MYLYRTLQNKSYIVHHNKSTKISNKNRKETKKIKCKEIMNKKN